MKELDYIIDKYKLVIGSRSPIEIPNVGRDTLAELFKELGYRVGVEIGVEKGLYAETLCKANPDALIYGVDAWKAYPNYRDHVSQDKLDGFYNETYERMRGYNWKPIRKFSLDAVNDFADGSLDFVYIDANHEFPFVVNDIIQWARKIRKGGIVSGHDYRKSVRFITRNHVVYAVNAYTQAYRVHPWFLFGIKDMLPGQIRDEARSWVWVKDHA